MATTFPAGFLWGASTAALQAGGNNINSDTWASEGLVLEKERPGAACDSYRRWCEDSEPRADAGLMAYPFSVERARIEPVGRDAADLFARLFLGAHSGGVVREWKNPTVVSDSRANESGHPQSLPAPDPEIGTILARVHEPALTVLRERTPAKVGWSAPNGALQARSRGGARLREEHRIGEDVHREALRGDRFVEVRSSSAQGVASDALEPHSPHPDATPVNTTDRPDARGTEERHVADASGGVPIIVTKSRIATAEDARRIACAKDALLDRETFARTPQPDRAWPRSVEAAGEVSE